MMDRYVTTLHTPESHVAVVDVDAGTATGVVNGHGELALGDQLLLAAYRYDDEYVRLDGRWVFAARTIRFMYNVPFEEMATSFADRRRLRVPGPPSPRATTPRPCPPGPPPPLVPFPGNRPPSRRCLFPGNGTCGRRSVRRRGIGQAGAMSATRRLLPGVFVGSHAIAEGFLTRGQLRRRGYRRLVQGVLRRSGPAVRPPAEVPGRRVAAARRRRHRGSLGRGLVRRTVRGRARSRHRPPEPRPQVATARVASASTRPTCDRATGR